MVLIETPLGNVGEREYVLSILFGERFELPWTLRQTDRKDVRIEVRNCTGSLQFPDFFFSQFAPSADKWLTPHSLPKFPLYQWDAREVLPGPLLAEPVIPVIYGAVPTRARSSKYDGNLQVDLPVDIFGSVFYMLSRYEEAVVLERDKHDRFPAPASLAYRAGFLDRPIVDEYVEILRAAMQLLWPSLRRKQRQPRTLVSCDVDSPFLFKGTPRSTLFGVGGALLKRRSLRIAQKQLIGNWKAWRGNYDLDEHRAGLDWIMRVNERAGRPAAFYFIPENTDLKLDTSISLTEPRMRALLREIHARGHEIGIHPGYNTYKHPEALTRSVATLRRVLDEEGIDQPYIGGRQHFLRWETRTTPRLLDNCGLLYDTTLSYADHPGFRCGTCREYPLYDLVNRRALQLRERPLIVMECSVIAERYLNLGYSDEALALMQNYRTICHRFGGDFTLLWHNSHLDTHDDRRFYQALVG